MRVPFEIELKFLPTGWNGFSDEELERIKENAPISKWRHTSNITLYACAYACNDNDDEDDDDLL